ncbi:2-phospho-L-lactate guanylyltransferase [Ancylobacter mangrovi]|uniref:2-phospho-L-lactate guanylyltransferase n=1 Tax=Ancylobacter mangrovi TaxID=2972472 RepID=UPI002161B3C3|nr:2-phospho-L-lactate guanylyltransferase [Ancylobacter mangrovi]MCS0504219.1 2-phospho-L-lactate guanylyltransferase [Ancylobacter mangrovi]
MNAGAAGIWAVVPVKEVALAKQRLASSLPPSLRQALVRAMMRDVLAALQAARGLAGTVVVTADAEAGLLAREHGARLIFERSVRGLNLAVAEAAARLRVDGAAGMLVLPADIPSVTPLEISDLVASHTRTPGVSLVPAHDGQGTNALLVSPPDLMTFSYGPMSCSLHAGSAQALGIAPVVHDPARFPGLALDVDLPRDIERLECLASTTRTRRLLEAEGLLGARARDPAIGHQ